MLQIATDNSLILDGRDTGLKLVQCADRTVVYTPDNRLTETPFRAHLMPFDRYATSHRAPASGVAGCAQLEADLRVLLDRLPQAH